MFALFLAAAGELRLPAFFSDHLVLQRASEVPLWGWCEPGGLVRVRASWLGDSATSARADAGGRWQVTLTTSAAAGPQELVIECGSERRVLADVRLGEVWLASGQSNMEWTLGPGVGNGVDGWEAAVAASEDPELRFFEVENALAPAPADDVRGAWRLASPATSGHFSATAYFFARALRRELGVPVGVISSEWGGTPAEGWTSAAGLAELPEFAPGLARLAELARDPAAARARQEEAQAAYWQRLEGLGLELNSGHWRDVVLPATFEQHGEETFDGVGTYSREVALPAAWVGSELVLELGPIDDRDTTSWNGERIGGHEGTGEWQTPRRYVVPAGLVRATNTLSVRVLDTGGQGGFHGGPGSLRLSRGDERFDLSGPWSWRRGPDMGTLGWPPSLENLAPHEPSALSNAMIAPLEPFALAGVIWYQGESNIGRDAQYRRLFPALIEDWRARFRRELPFLFVQIAPFGYGGDTGQAAWLREAQRAALELPRTGMAVTMDIGDPRDIHPLEKRLVGERLALHALAQSYGHELVASGPLFHSLRVEGSRLRIRFEHARGLRTDGKALAHLELCGADGVWHAAESAIEDDALVAWSAAVPAPLHARLGFGAADLLNLWNEAGLPAASFTSVPFAP
jgi:sialate O-acetylesterase